MAARSEAIPTNATMLNNLAHRFPERDTGKGRSRSQDNVLTISISGEDHRSTVRQVRPAFDEGGPRAVPR